jgi:hypothetical protein
MTTEQMKQASIAELARVIRSDWKRINFAAVPYLQAMSQLDSVKDKYGFDDGESIVAYFLSNASTWRGEVAKAVKAELNSRLRAVTT